ncbi:hypothetical protein QQZ08_001325 [Neonectria magnoliae]|uniref:Uncharacterized protein n=1 Tax=Neonectria magnoliae TaxID=2732573 RepID=A0ABR1IG59_9HYPO
MALPSSTQVIPPIQTGGKSLSSRPSKTNPPVSSGRKPVSGQSTGTKRSRPPSMKTKAPAAKRRHAGHMFVLEDGPSGLEPRFELEETSELEISGSEDASDSEDVQNLVLLAGLHAIRMGMARGTETVTHHVVQTRAAGAEDIEAAIKDVQRRFNMPSKHLVKFVQEMRRPENAVCWNALGNDMEAKKEVLFSFVGERFEAVER